MTKQKIPWLVSLWFIASASLMLGQKAQSKVPRSQPFSITQHPNRPAEVNSIHKLRTEPV